MVETAFFWGIVSALSLPLGAILGLVWRPGSRITSAFMAFGAGALLFALTIELMAHVPHYVDTHGNGALVVAVIGAVAGGVLFSVLNKFLNDRGAFLRSLSNVRDHVARTKKARARRLLRRLAKISVLKDLPSDDLAELVKYVRKERFAPGELIFRRGDDSREIHFVREGGVRLYEEVPDRYARDDSPPATNAIAEFQAGDTFGERAVISGVSRQTTARAATRTTLYTLDKDDLDVLLEQRPQLKPVIEALASHQDHAGADELDAQAEGDDELDTVNLPISERDIQEESRGAAGSAGAAMAIWLGIAIDGVPESLVIGTLAIDTGGMSLAFIVGVFLANFPEAMSSAVIMRRHAFSIPRIMWMWSSLCLLTGLGAMFGAWVFPPDPAGTAFFIKLAVEGVAAGAMLTMIAETMLPEAFEHGGSVTGLATLIGFLAALSVAALGA
ncbi:cyclic nucleotide-binding domain-containing protein [Allohahella marinimesophila]|uniref:Cyclic nucleotide-binding domain-containing protein n=1 Tax=Allohahella marinimesophila TaxID=1054972 RepID=A0ABP7PX55_9GAMM